MEAAPQLAFEADTLDEAVIEVMRMAALTKQEVIWVSAPAHQEFNLKVAGQVREYVIRAAQLAYEVACKAQAVARGYLDKVIYRGTYVVFERIASPDDLRRLIFDRAQPDPIHVAQFWKRLGAD